MPSPGLAGRGGTRLGNRCEPWRAAGQVSVGISAANRTGRLFSLGLKIKLPAHLAKHKLVAFKPNTEAYASEDGGAIWWVGCGPTLGGRAIHGRSGGTLHAHLTRGSGGRRAVGRDGDLITIFIVIWCRRAGWVSRRCGTWVGASGAVHVPPAPRSPSRCRALYLPDSN